jgi:hypothetical protein
LLVTIIGSISQLFILPTLSSTIGERKVLSTGLLMEFFNATCLSVAWSPWVPYAMTMLVPGAMFVMPSVRFYRIIVLSNGALYLVLFKYILNLSIGLWYCVKTSWIQ